jgi:hypothetical protein
MHSQRTYGSVNVLSGEHNVAYAEELLVRAAKQTEPICEKRGWTVKRLIEFYPSTSNLYGLNYNRGAEVSVRLRLPGDRASFCEYQSILRTLLHELCHNVHSAHSAEFYKLLDELTDECETLIARGVSQGMGHGTRLGGNRVVVTNNGNRLGASDPRDAQREAVRKAWLQRSRLLSARGDVQRLGGDVARSKSLTPAQAAAQAAERRFYDDKNCATTALVDTDDNDDDDQIEIIRVSQQQPPLTTTQASPAKRRRLSAPIPAAKKTPPPPPPQIKTWQCRECTLINDIVHVRCDACNTPRHVAPPKTTRMWICSACTFANGSSASVCAVCNTAMVKS